MSSTSGVQNTGAVEPEKPPVPCLPPGVRGSVFGELQVCVDHLLWSRDQHDINPPNGPPRPVVVCPLWWGESAPPPRLMPFNGWKGQADIVRATVDSADPRPFTCTYHVRTNLDRFSNYLKDMKALVLSVLDPTTNTPIGQAVVPNMVALTSTRPIMGYYPVTATGIGHTADLRISIHLKPSDDPRPAPNQSKNPATATPSAPPPPPQQIPTEISAMGTQNPRPTAHHALPKTPPVAAGAPGPSTDATPQAVQGKSEIITNPGFSIPKYGNLFGAGAGVSPRKPVLSSSYPSFPQSEEGKPNFRPFSSTPSFLPQPPPTSAVQTPTLSAAANWETDVKNTAFSNIRMDEPTTTKVQPPPKPIPPPRRTSPQQTQQNLSAKNVNLPLDEISRNRNTEIGHGHTSGPDPALAKSHRVTFAESFRSSPSVRGSENEVEKSGLVWEPFVTPTIPSEIPTAKAANGHSRSRTSANRKSPKHTNSGKMNGGFGKVLDDVKGWKMFAGGEGATDPPVRRVLSAHRQAYSPDPLPPLPVPKHTPTDPCFACNQYGLRTRVHDHHTSYDPGRVTHPVRLPNTKQKRTPPKHRHFPTKQREEYEGPDKEKPLEISADRCVAVSLRGLRLYGDSVKRALVTATLREWGLAQEEVEYVHGQWAPRIDLHIPLDCDHVIPNQWDEAAVLVEIWTVKEDERTGGSMPSSMLGVARIPLAAVRDHASSPVSDSAAVVCSNEACMLTDLQTNEAVGAMRFSIMIGSKSQLEIAVPATPSPSPSPTTTSPPSDNGDSPTDAASTTPEGRTKSPPNIIMEIQTSELAIPRKRNFNRSQPTSANFRKPTSHAGLSTAEPAYRKIPVTENRNPENRIGEKGGRVEPRTEPKNPSVPERDMSPQTHTERGAQGSTGRISISTDPQATVYNGQVGGSSADHIEPWGEIHAGGGGPDEGSRVRVSGDEQVLGGCGGGNERTVEMTLLCGRNLVPLGPKLSENPRACVSCEWGAELSRRWMWPSVDWSEAPTWGSSIVIGWPRDQSDVSNWERNVLHLCLWQKTGDGNAVRVGNGPVDLSLLNYGLDPISGWYDLFNPEGHVVGQVMISATLRVGVPGSLPLDITQESPPDNQADNAVPDQSTTKDKNSNQLYMRDNHPAWIPLPLAHAHATFSASSDSFIQRYLQENMARLDEITQKIQQLNAESDTDLD